MQRQIAIDILNRIYRNEGSSLLPHMAHTSPHTSRGNMPLGDAMKKVIAHRSAAIEWLAEQIYNLGGSPRPVRPPDVFAELHYLTYEYLLPAALRDLENVAAVYASAERDIPGGELKEKVTELAAGVNEDLELLSQFRDQLKAKSSRLNVSVDPNVLGKPSVPAEEEEPDEEKVETEAGNSTSTG